MGKAVKPSDPSGLLVVDKPQGVTSHDVVAAVRSMLHTKRVGHAGTLDPMATGVLVIGFGHVTRLLNYIVDHHKTYEATIRLGQRTTTDDADGDIVSCVPTELSELADGNEDDSAIANATVNATVDRLADHNDGRYGDGGEDDAAEPFCEPVRRGQQSRVLTRDQIEHAISDHLVGTIEQVPSSYSAIKVNGRRAYDLARSGQNVRLAARRVSIDEFRVVSVACATVKSPAAQSKEHLGADGADASGAGDGGADSGFHEGGSKNSRTGAAGNRLMQQEHVSIPVVDVSVRVTCSAGTYIRSLGRDLGELLGVGGHLTRLRRTRISRFNVSAPNVVRGVRAEPHTFTNREGQSVTKNRAVLDASRDDLLARSLSMFDAAQAVMPMLRIDESEARDLRYGRRLHRDIADASTDECAFGEDESCGTHDADEAAGAHGADGQTITAAAYLPETGEVVALVEPTSPTELRPVVVFPA